MKFINIFGLVLFSSVLCYSQTTYYISSSVGSDSNLGTTELNPWKTIKKVNSIDLKAGDNVLFKAGDFWAGEQLLIKNSGTAASRIIYSSYGIGSKPIITLQEEIEGWKSPTNWKATSGLINVWEMDFTSPAIFDRMWLNGKEAKLASYMKLRTDKYSEQPGANSSYPNGIYLGDNVDGTTGVCKEHQFYWHNSSSKLYLYAPQNPAEYYTSIQYPGKSAIETVSLIDANYITIDGLDVQGGLWASIALSGSNYIIITNSDIGKNANYKGIYGDNYKGKSKKSEHITISNNNINCFWEYDYIFYTKRTPQGIHMENGASYWEIYDNTITDWWMNVYISAVKAPSQFINIYNNEITAPNNSFGKAIQVSSGGTWNTPPTYVNFYNNYVHDICFGIQLSASNNKFYFNIFKDLKLISTNSHGPNQGGFMVMVIGDVQQEKAEENYFINNTCYNLRESANLNNSRNSYYLNNLLINTGEARNGVASYVTQSKDATYQNNLYFNENYNIDHKYIYLGQIGSFSVNEWNNLNGQYSKTISGNMQHTGSTNSLVNNATLELPNFSPALNAGIDISEFIPEGFRDRNGTLVNRKAPNIGALGNLDNSSDVKPAVSKSSFKVFLEGAYKNNNMSAFLKVPFSQPYRESNWNHVGNENFSTAPAKLIDWILVELRTSINSTAYKFAALLLDDGKIVNEYGLEDFSNHNIIDGDYYIIVYHRNHLPIISSKNISVSSSQIIYDFSDSQSKAQGNSSMKELSEGVFGMYSGDSDGNGVINNLDFGNVANNIFSSNYSSGDLDLNGIINVLDYSKINSNIFKKTELIE